MKLRKSALHLVFPLIYQSQDIFIPTNEAECEQLVKFLDKITDMVMDNEEHPLANLMDVLGTLIEIYEDQAIPEPAPDPISTLKH